MTTTPQPAARPAARSRPFFPIQRVEPDGPGDQRLHPVVDQLGAPKWLAGDSRPEEFYISSVGFTHGAVRNRKIYPDIRGRVYVTGARLVAISDHFAHGTRYTGYSPTNYVIGRIATKVSETRADNATAGTYLVAQMRHPWVSTVIYAPPTMHRSQRGEVRVCARHKTAFGDPETVILFLRLDPPDVVLDFVAELVDRIRVDRHNWERTTDTERMALDQLPDPATVGAAPDQLPIIRLPGSFFVGSGSANQGVVSSLSFPT
jgi:hypothetical protein